MLTHVDCFIRVYQVLRIQIIIMVSVFCYPNITHYAGIMCDAILAAYYVQHYAGIIGWSPVQSLYL